jgi:hypothetical protein
VIAMIEFWLVFGINVGIVAAFSWVRVETIGVQSFTCNLKRIGQTSEYR